MGLAKCSPGHRRTSGSEVRGKRLSQEGDELGPESRGHCAEKACRLSAMRSTVKKSSMTTEGEASHWLKPVPEGSPDTWRNI